MNRSLVDMLNKEMSTITLSYRHLDKYFFSSPSFPLLPSAIHIYSFLSFFQYTNPTNHKHLRSTSSILHRILPHNHQNGLHKQQRPPKPTRNHLNPNRNRTHHQQNPPPFAPTPPRKAKRPAAKPINTTLLRLRLEPLADADAEPVRVSPRFVRESCCAG